jgi:orotate phosphoribosyltransferase
VDKAGLARKIYEKSHLVGNFILRSGQKSNEYFDKYLFESDPRILMDIIKEMKLLIPQEIDIIAGLEMGGIPLVTALSIETGMNSVFVRKLAKEYGTCKIAEGIDIKNKKVCIIEDVVTTGGQIISSVHELRSRGAIVDTVICVILRNDEAIELLKKEDLDLKYILSMEYILKIVKE